ncbi:MAG: STAS domain-containing protein [Candidatus Auribacterota bacterium]|jgi:anti-sigma B factor antagonist|nr:STAS domain-containing protein [Candidatus Auribacterota bacterium]
MHIQIKEQGDIVIFQIEGEIDLYNSPGLRQQLTSRINKGSKKILVDFSNVKYIDSSGLATLIEGLQKMNRQKGRMMLCCLNQSIMDIFEVARLDDVFNIYNTAEEALDDMAK